MRMIVYLSAMTACLAMAVPALAGGDCGGEPSCCADCGCKAPCRKVCCQIVCDYEEVEVKCWDVKCEEYCLPIPVLGSCLGGRKACDPGCGCDLGCGSDTGCCGLLNDRCQGGKCEPAVTCGHPRVKKTLMLRTVKVKKPVYKCVTKYLCGGCEAEAAAAPGAAPVPEAAPAPQAAPLPPVSKQAAVPVAPRF